MDPASLALGILPLVVGAIKAYSGLRKKAEVFRHYSRELRRLQKHLDVERRLFLNETQILVLAAVDDGSLAVSMLEDPDRDEWNSPVLEQTFRKLLDRSYDEYFDTLSDISEVIEEMQAELDCFKLFESSRQEGEKVKRTIDRMRDGAKITWNKTKLEESLKELHESNGELQRLGEQMRKINKMTAGQSVANGHSKPLSQEYADFGMVRRAAKAFYDALANAWSPRDERRQTLTSSRHEVRFFLDTKVLDSVSMDLMVVCPGHKAKDVMIPQPLTLRVRSQVVPWVDSGLSGPDSILSSAKNSEPRKRRVHFEEKDSDRLLSEHALKQQSTVQLTLPNLSDRDLCSFLLQTPPGQTCDKCVGYIESCCDETFRHSIYNFIPGTHNLKKVVSIDQVLDNPAEKSVSIVDQLKLARSLVAAVLKFHSTPWLVQYLTLRDISLFNVSQDFSQCLSTLHFDTSFAASQLVGSTPQGLEADMVGLEESLSRMAIVTEDAKLDHGIRNMTLWCLGVILMQIGHWSRLAEPENVRQVRRFSYQVPILGQRYQQLARRCLECDFGYGEDLSRPPLQQAVYERVYCELVSMINVLDPSKDC